MKSCFPCLKCAVLALCHFHRLSAVIMFTPDVLKKVDMLLEGISIHFFGEQKKWFNPV